MRVDSVSPALPQLDTKDDKKLKKACQDFEAVFMGFMLKGMRKTVQKTDLFGSSKEEEMFQDMMDDEVCKAASKRNSTGVADLLYKQLSNGLKPQALNDTRGEIR